MPKTPYNDAYSGEPLHFNEQTAADKKFQDLIVKILDAVDPVQLTKEQIVNLIKIIVAECKEAEQGFIAAIPKFKQPPYSREDPSIEPVDKFNHRLGFNEAISELKKNLKESNRG